MSQTITFDPPQSPLLRLVRNGSLNFERFVEVHVTREFIVERDKEDKFGFGRVDLEAMGGPQGQEDLTKLLALLIPELPHEILIACHSTDKGGHKGAFSYAIYNENIIDIPRIEAILVRENAASLK